MKTKLTVGMRVILLNKFGDEIADGIIDEITKTSVILAGGDEFLFKHVASERVDAATVQLSIVGTSL